MKCIECGHENPNSPRYCTRCGQPMGGVEGAAGQVRKTQAEAGLFDSPPVPTSPWTPPAPPPQLMPAPLPTVGQVRRTVLEEGGAAAAAAPPPLPGAMSLPAMPGQRPSGPVPQAGGRNKTVLDESPMPAAPAAPGQAQQVVQAPGTARAVGWMVSFDRNVAGQDYVLRAGRNRLGRGRDIEVSLFFEPKASDLHATIIWRNGQVAVKDEGSTNGTMVNGDDIGIGAVSPLHTGDTLTIGGSTFIVFFVDPKQARATWPNSPWAA